MLLQVDELALYGPDGDPQHQADNETLMRAVAGLPKLQELAVNDAVCGPYIGWLGGAEQLTRLKFVRACECGASESALQGCC